MHSRRGPPTALRVVPPDPSCLLVLQAGTSSSLSPSPPPRRRPRSVRNMKNLSINLPSRNVSSLPLTPIGHDPSAIDPNPRRPSVLSIPSTSLSSVVLRQDEDGSPTIPYATGPVQVLPGIWLGSEDNARDWPSLRDRGISAILNVAKEVLSSFDSARPVVSAPIPTSHASHPPSTFYPPHAPSGRPAMHYLKLSWSHGQRDLVTGGFPTAMAFIDAAIQRNQGVLIHCQCGISRSATLMIAVVMRAAISHSPSVPPDVWHLKGMQAAYAFVKEKSRDVGPNMSLIYQLLDYERVLQGDHPFPLLSDPASSLSDEDKEWGCRRDAFTHQDGNDAVQQEARDLDRAMERRAIARNPSIPSLKSGMGMAPAWRGRYSRRRAGSVTSIRTTGSVLSEDLVEADEEPELLGVGGAFDDALELRRSPSLSSGSPGSPTDGRNIRSPPNPSVARPCTQPSPSLLCNLNIKIVPGKGKRRTAALGTLSPVPCSPISPSAVQDSKPPPRRRKHLLRRQAPRPQLEGHTSSIAFPPSVSSQTLFVFPPSPTVTKAMRAPATMTVTSNCPFSQTPHVATSRCHGRARSFIGLGTPVAPTTAYSRVDARGWIELESQIHAGNAA